MKTIIALAFAALPVAAHAQAFIQGNKAVVSREAVACTYLHDYETVAAIMASSSGLPYPVSCLPLAERTPVLVLGTVGLMLVKVMVTWGYASGRQVWTSGGYLEHAK